MFSTTLGRLSRLLSVFAIAFAMMISTAISLSVMGCQVPPNGSSIPTQPLRVGTSGDYAPFSLDFAGKPDGNFQPAGFSIDVARAFASHTGRRVEFVQFDWPKLSQSLAAEHFDFALSGVTVRPDRSIAGRFSHPLTVSGAVVLTRTKSGARPPRRSPPPRSNLRRQCRGPSRTNDPSTLSRSSRRSHPSQSSRPRCARSRRSRCGRHGQSRGANLACTQRRASRDRPTHAGPKSRMVSDRQARRNRTIRCVASKS